MADILREAATLADMHESQQKSLKGMSEQDEQVSRDFCDFCKSVMSFAREREESATTSVHKAMGGLQKALEQQLNRMTFKGEEAMDTASYWADMPSIAIPPKCINPEDLSPSKREALIAMDALFSAEPADAAGIALQPVPQQKCIFKSF